MEEKEVVEPERGDDGGGHLDDEEHSGRPDNLGETGSKGPILRRENLSNDGVGHSPHTKAIRNTGNE